MIKRCGKLLHREKASRLVDEDDRGGCALDAVTYNRCVQLYRCLGHAISEVRLACSATTWPRRLQSGVTQDWGMRSE